MIEFQSRDKRLAKDAQPCVIAEIVFDSTSHDLRPATVLVTTATETRDMSEEPAGVKAAPGPGGLWHSLINPVVKNDGMDLEQAA